MDDLQGRDFAGDRQQGGAACEHGTSQPSVGSAECRSVGSGVYECYCPTAPPGIDPNVKSDPLWNSDPWSQYGTAGGSSGGVPGGPSPSVPQVRGSHAVARDGRWHLYDEKYHFQTKSAYDAKHPEVWLQDQRDYLAGRTAEIDAVIGWVERQSDVITKELAQSYAGLLDCATIEEISHQM